MKPIKSLLVFATLCSGFVAHSQDAALENLKTTYNNWVQAWNELDAKKVAEISGGNYGFGRDVPFARDRNDDNSSYEQNYQRYMNSMETIGYEVYHSNFRIVDGIGLVDGFYAQTTKPKDGPLRTVYGRQSLVLSNKSGKWKIIHYHRSALPNEFVR